MAVYTLPDLDWDYGALEPHISGQINELHHTKHHAGYVKGANDALAKLEEARANDDHSAILQNEKSLAFNLGGHVNHTLWWKNLSPDGGDKPTGELAAAIDEAFGSFDKFRAQFTAAATTVQGSGWAALGYDSLAGKLLVFQVYDHQSNFPLGIVPLLLLDMWEHAFYLQYKNVKADFAKAFWNVVNWADVQARYAGATAKAKGLIAG
ncbi:superoxide dismutase [Mycobacterium sp. SM1]|uniref:superoxide dismutase n=1 Tax=Mycobacterium sp. SM1 TaxID=2816243 RepID=UPI001BCAFAE7|nr:superoxide dismutase [Mycobacterium sp. SM1]MBS4728023.1 superoxide dismutase [Mycobacterium sp. SM1]